MRLPRALSDCVMFACWCREHSVEPASAARLIALARTAFHRGERAISINQPGLQELWDKAIAAFEEAAANEGFLTAWPGLWPVLRKARGDSTYDISLPDIG